MSYTACHKLSNQLQSMPPVVHNISFKWYDRSNLQLCFIHPDLRNLNRITGSYKIQSFVSNTLSLLCSFSIPVWASAWPSSTVACCTSSPLFTLLAFALERISIFIFSIPIIRTSGWTSGFQPRSCDPVGTVCLFSGVVRASDKIIRLFFYILYFVYWTTFRCSRNDRVSWQNDSLRFHQNLFVWL